MKDIKERLACILGIDSQCTEEQLVEAVERLKSNEEMLNLAIDNSVDSFSIADSKGMFLKVNDTFTHYTGISKEEMEGSTTRELIESGSYGPDSAILLAIKERKRVAVLQNGRVRDLSGKKSDKELTNGEAIAISTPIFDDNGDIRYVVSNARFIHELELLKKYLDDTKNLGDHEQLKNQRKMIWKSMRMKEILGLVKVVAPTDSSVMISGETGTGKSMLARYIHEQSSRRDKAFVEINCAAIPENLIESELFGYESGAFTGASKNGKKGLMEIADGGTLFLDEIGDMPLSLQATLLQSLQNRSFTRVGGEKQINVDVRLITATNMDLEQMVQEGTFRNELYYRINVVPINLPRLSERREDFQMIVDVSMERFTGRYNKEVVLSREARKLMEAYSWPGNIRELENTVERLVVTNRNGVIFPADLPSKIIAENNEYGGGVMIDDIMPLKKATEEIEKQLISAAYVRYGSSYKVAEALGISQSAASRKIIKYLKNSSGEEE